MSYYVVSHTVADFDSWKKVYDAFEPTRERFGIKEHYALQSADDPNHVLVVGEGDLDAIQKFLHSAELKEGMEGAGVSSEPQVFIGNNLK
jgi:hypothetical protein